MIFVYSHELLVDERKHVVDLTIKQSLELLAYRLSEPRMQMSSMLKATYCVNIIFESSMEISGWWCPGARPGTSRGILGRVEMTGVPKEHLTLSNLSRTSLSATSSGFSSKYSRIFSSRARMISWKSMSINAEPIEHPAKSLDIFDCTLLPSNSSQKAIITFYIGELLQSYRLSS